MEVPSLRLMLMSRKGRLTGEEFTVNLIEGWKELIWRIKSSSSRLYLSRVERCHPGTAPKTLQG